MWLKESSPMKGIINKVKSMHTCFSFSQPAVSGMCFRGSLAEKTWVCACPLPHCHSSNLSFLPYPLKYQNTASTRHRQVSVWLVFDTGYSVLLVVFCPQYSSLDSRPMAHQISPTPNRTAKILETCTNIHKMHYTVSNNALLLFKQNVKNAIKLANTYNS